jgi:hypothetical protein
MGVLQLQQQNVAAAAAYTEYSFKVPPNAMQFTMILRPGGSTGSASPANVFWYLASSPNGTNNSAGLPTVFNAVPLQNSPTHNSRLGRQTVYFQVDQPNQIVELDYNSDT